MRNGRPLEQCWRIIWYWIKFFCVVLFSQLLYVHRKFVDHMKTFNQNYIYLFLVNWKLLCCCKFVDIYIKKNSNNLEGWTKVIWSYLKYKVTWESWSVKCKVLEKCETKQKNQPNKNDLNTLVKVTWNFSGSKLKGGGTILIKNFEKRKDYGYSYV